MDTTIVESNSWKDKLRSYLVFTKFRLSALVVISALSGYLFVGGNDGHIIYLLMVGGSLVTAASNGSNQIWEREIDILMKRTEVRPLPQKRMSLTEAYIIVVVCLLVGTYMLYQINFKLGLMNLCYVQCMLIKNWVEFREFKL